MEQIIVNILSDAIDAAADTRSGTVRVRCRHDSGTIEIVVDDNGRGIASEIAAHSLSLFRQQKSAASALDYRWSRQIVEAHGEENLVGADSSRGDTLSRGPACKRAGPMNDATVYVVDDDAAIRNSLSVLLETCGLHWRTFASAEDFVAKLSRHDTGLRGRGQVSAGHERT